MLHLPAYPKCLKTLVFILQLSLALVFCMVPIQGSAEDKSVPPSLRTPLIDAHLESMRARILQGIHSGELSPGEAHALTAKLERIIRLEEKLKHDNSLRPRERAELRRQSRQLSDEIFKEKHDVNTAKPGPRQ